MNNKLSEKTMGFIRLALFAFPLINTILVMAGFAPLPFDEFQLENILIMVVGFIAGIWAWWMDNPISKKAIAEKEMVKILTEKDKL